MSHPKVICACVVSCLFALVAGCERDEEKDSSSSVAVSNESGLDRNAAVARLELELQSVLMRFENAESRFGPSTTPDQLTENAGWLDLMTELLGQVERIHEEADRLGIATTPGIRESLRSRHRRHHKTFMESVRQVKEYVDYHTTLDALRNL
jgi:hypothetical protein